MQRQCSLLIASGKRTDPTLLHEIPHTGIFNNTRAALVYRQSTAVVGDLECSGIKLHESGKDLDWGVCSASNVDRELSALVFGFE